MKWIGTTVLGCASVSRFARCSFFCPRPVVGLFKVDERKRHRAWYREMWCTPSVHTFSQCKYRKMVKRLYKPTSVCQSYSYIYIYLIVSAVRACEQWIARRHENTYNLFVQYVLRPQFQGTLTPFNTCISVCSVKNGACRFSSVSEGWRKMSQRHLRADNGNRVCVLCVTLWPDTKITVM